MQLLHLVSRFVGSLDPRPVPPADDEWARSHLVPGEVALWEQMPRADRRHSIGVAREAVASLGPAASRPVVAAALLHDVGKIESGLGTYRRAVATVVGAVLGRQRASAGDGRIARYLRHDSLGADALDAAGSDPLTSTWAREHHRPAEQWTIERTVADALHAADND